MHYIQELAIKYRPNINSYKLQIKIGMGKRNLKNIGIMFVSFNLNVPSTRILIKIPYFFNER